MDSKIYKDQIITKLFRTYFFKEIKSQKVPPKSMIQKEVNRNRWLCTYGVSWHVGTRTCLHLNETRI